MIGVQQIRSKRPYCYLHIGKMIDVLKIIPMSIGNHVSESKDCNNLLWYVLSWVKMKKKKNL